MKPCIRAVMSAFVFIQLTPVCSADDRKITFDFQDAAADYAFSQALTDPGQMEALLAFPAALAIPRLEYYMNQGRDAPARTLRARELIPKVTGWQEYYQWILAETYKDANPPPGAKAILTDEIEVPQYYSKARAARTKIEEIFTHLSYISDPGTVSLIAPYLDDQGPLMGRDDVSIPTVEGAAWDAISNYFKRQTGKRPDMLPDQWRAWWKANKANYPVLPEQPRKPWFPPPATPKPATPPPRTPDIVGDYVHKHMPEMVAQREAERKMQASMATPSPATPVPQIPHLRTEDEARPQRWLVAGICTLLAAAAAYFILRPRR